MAGSMPEGLYDLRVDVHGADNEERTALVQQAVLTGLHLKLQTRVVNRSAYVLRRSATARGALDPPASDHKMMQGYWHGRYVLINGTMEDLAYVLATGLKNPIVDETGITAKFDIRFKVATDTIESVNAVLRETLGAELVAGGKEMSITVQELSAAKDSRSSTSTMDGTTAR